MFWDLIIDFICEFTSLVFHQDDDIYTSRHIQGMRRIYLKSRPFSSSSLLFPRPVIHLDPMEALLELERNLQRLETQIATDFRPSFPPGFSQLIQLALQEEEEEEEDEHHSSSNNIGRSFTVNQENQTGRCSICLDSIVMNETANEIPCGHVFHESCIDGWLRISRTCPLCRQNF